MDQEVAGVGSARQGALCEPGEGRDRQQGLDWTAQEGGSPSQALARCGRAGVRRTRPLSHA